MYTGRYAITLLQWYTSIYTSRYTGRCTVTPLQWYTSIYASRYIQAGTLLNCYNGTLVYMLVDIQPFSLLLDIRTTSTTSIY